MFWYYKYNNVKDYFNLKRVRCEMLMHIMDIGSHQKAQPHLKYTHLFILSKLLSMPIWTNL